MRTTLLAAMAVLLLAGPISAATAASGPAASQPAATQPADLLSGLTRPDQTMTLVQWAVLLTVLAAAPAVGVLVTSFTRIAVVLGLLRQALATQQLPPNQVLFGLALLMTLAVMSPVIGDLYQQALEPYLAGRIAREQAFDTAQARIRAFMIGQIETAGNSQDVYVFLDDKLARRQDLTWSHVPTLSLIPAYAISELKVAFQMGFRIFLPFLVVDLLVASVLTSMGILMLPPVLVSLPLKLLLFVLADGWHLVAGTLMRSFA